MKAPSMLHAKSTRHALSLNQHLTDTRQAALALFREDRRWGRSFLRFFGIPASEHARFLTHLQAASLLHDIGKANEDFQHAVSCSDGVRQTLRHEHLSALFIHQPQIWKWLSSAKGIDLQAITAAVLSHHLKAAETPEEAEKAPVWGQPQTMKPAIRLFFDHPEVRAMLDVLATLLGIGPAPVQFEPVWSLEGGTWQGARSDGLRAARALKAEIRREPSGPRARLVMALKAGVIAADSAASGLVREHLCIEEWMDDITGLPALTSADVDTQILEPRMQQIAQRLGEPFSWQPFQLEIAEVGPRALLLAACGAGKTLAAWSWARTQLRSREAGRVIFLYPTRGTATEGFRDYVAWAPESDATLLHSSSRYELERMRDNPSEAAKGKSFVLSDADARLFALGLWSKKYFSATVDQFLGFLEHQYTGMCLLPALADSVVIIDEVHSFDPHLFGNLVRFLSAFDVPVLCMTATLPESQREVLEKKVGLRVYPDDAAHNAELHRLESTPRYRLSRVDSEEAAIEQCVAAYRSGQRVLWVVNTVARCQDLAERLEKRAGAKVLCYHSRYTLGDRQERHQETVKAFQQEEEPVIAVTTQVCEMSLDLDADVLITEHAPVTSLIQRFGRANRRLKRERAHLFTYAPPAVLPYDRSDLAAADRFLAEIKGRDISQADLAAALLRHAPRETISNAAARFESGGYYAVPGELRDIDEIGRTAVLDGDINTVRELLKKHSPIDKHLLSVPRRDAITDDPRLGDLPKYVALAKSSQYTTTRGFCASQGETQ